MVGQPFKVEVGSGGEGAPSGAGGGGAPFGASGDRYPFSGNVAQTINPWTWFLRMSGIEVGQLTVNLGTSTNPGLEQAILTKVGTYGRQLGVIGDALDVVVRHMDRLAGGDLSQDDRDALDQLRRQLDEIDALKFGPDSPRRRRRRPGPAAEPEP